MKRQAEGFSFAGVARDRRKQAAIAARKQKAAQEAAKLVGQLRQRGIIQVPKTPNGTFDEIAYRNDLINAIKDELRGDRLFRWDLTADNFTVARVRKAS